MAVPISAGLVRYDTSAGRLAIRFRQLPLFSHISPSIRLLAATVLSGALVGCAAPGVPDVPLHDAATLPAAWTQPTPDGPAGAELRSWWKAFDDPMLDQLVQDALAQNLDVAQAASRLRQARLQANRAARQFQPSASIHVETLQDIAAIDTYFHASVEMVWELGLFGAAQSIRKAGLADANAAAADAQGIRVAIVADVVRHYLDLKAAQRHIHWLSQTAALDARAVPLAQARLQARIGTADDILQARAQSARAMAAAAVPREAAAHAAQMLALLLGRAQPDPAWLQAGKDPGVPQGLAPFALTALPADLLRTRPDIHAAEAQVLQAAAALGLARSALYPRIALTGSLLYAYNLTQNFTTKNDYVPAVGPVIDIPLFDWGQRRLQVDARQEALDAALLGYRQTILRGIAEAESALAGMSAQQARTDALRQALAITRERAAASQTRVRLGLSSEYDDLAARRALLQAHMDLATAQDAYALSFIALYKALGGAPLPEPDAPDSDSDGSNDGNNVPAKSASQPDTGAATATTAALAGARAVAGVAP